MNKSFNLWLCFISYRCFNRRFWFFVLLFFFLSFPFRKAQSFSIIKAFTAVSLTTDIISPHQNQYYFSTCLVLYSKSTWICCFFLSFQKFNQADILNHYEVFRSRIAFEINHYMQNNRLVAHNVMAHSICMSCFSKSYSNHVTTNK